MAASFPVRVKGVKHMVTDLAYHVSPGKADGRHVTPAPPCQAVAWGSSSTVTRCFDMQGL